MSLLQAASLNTVAIYFLNGFFLIFLWVFLCVRVCVFAGDRDCRSRDRFQRVRTSRACIPCAQDFAKCKSTLSLLCWSSSTASSSFGDGIFLLHN